jgi:Ca-activated chloride channel family protein
MNENFEFTHPHFLWLLLLVPFFFFWFYAKRNTGSATLAIPDLRRFETTPSLLARLKPLLNLLRILAVVLLIFALARPRNTMVSTVSKSNKGIDIIMAIDVSASMLAKDLKPNRLEALKQVATTFVNQRPNDRIGIVAYAGESFTKTPLTTDKRIIRTSIEGLKWGELDGGTAIGMGLGSSVNRLKDSKAKSKVVILLTDGVNNSGFVDPITAAELAVELKIKVYTIGLGTNGTASTPAFIDRMSGKIEYRQAKVEIDEKLLKKIATETGGKYFRATNNNKLKAIYEEINKLEKTEIEEFKYYNYQEKYRLLVLIAGFFLLIEFLLRNTIYKSFI